MYNRLMEIDIWKSAICHGLHGGATPATDDDDEGNHPEAPIYYSAPLRM